MRLTCTTLFLLALFVSNGAHAADPLRFSVTITGNHDIDWDMRLTTNTLPGGYADELTQSGTEFVDYKSAGAAIMEFKRVRGGGLVGRVKGRGINKYPRLHVDITNTNVCGYTCSGVCPPPPSLAPYNSGCGHITDTANIKLTYESGTFQIESLRFSDLPKLPNGTVLPPGFDASLYVLPVGTAIPTACGPIFPPNNPAQDLVDYRYPFLASSNSDILPGKSASAVDRKLQSIKIGKTLTLNFGISVSPAKILMFDGSGYDYSGEVGSFWKVKLKRIS